MAGGRHSPALFELIKGAQANPSAPPPRAPEPAPRRVERPAERPWVTERAAGSAPERARMPALPSSAAMLVCAAVLGLAVVVYVVGYKLGFSRGEDSTLKALGVPNRGAPVQDPLKTPDIAVNPDLLKPAPKPDGTAAPGVPGDPRTPGLNYLVLAGRLDRATADRLVEFLGAGGVPAMAAPVDRPGRSAKNPPEFNVCALQGVSREDLRSRAPARADLEAKAAELGRLWKRDHKGYTDFSDMFWDKYGP